MTPINSVTLDSASAATGTVDHSYSQFPLQKTDDATPTMTFDDFLDMINPLQHIPLVSSIYRGVTGATINPVSRIAGDALYGGVFGLASAGIAALGALGDEIFTAAHDGKSASSTMMASLFGDDASDQATQLASADQPNTLPAVSDTGLPLAALDRTDSSALKVGALQTPATQSPILDMPQMATAAPTNLMATAASPVAAPVQLAQSSTPLPAPPQTPLTVASSSGQGMALDRSKPAYGGVMDTAMVQNAQQNQALALALAGGRSSMQSQHDIRNNRFATSNNAASSTSGASAAPASIVNSMPTLQAAAAQSQIAAVPSTPTAPSMASLIQNLQSMKGLAKYRSTAQSIPVMGGSVDVSN